MRKRELVDSDKYMIYSMPSGGSRAIETRSEAVADVVRGDKVVG